MQKKSIIPVKLGRFKRKLITLVRYVHVHVRTFHEDIVRTYNCMGIKRKNVEDCKTTFVAFFEP